MTETEFRTKVVKRARELGWVVYYWYDTRMASTRKNTSGFPDLILVGGRFLIRELKTDKGKIRPEQVECMSLLADAGVDVGVWRPKDWDLIEAELQNRGETAQDWIKAMITLTQKDGD